MQIAVEIVAFPSSIRVCAFPNHTSVPWDRPEIRIRSEKLCGFVINTGDATAEDVTELIRQVAERVKAQSGVTLEPEVKLLGEF